MAELCSRPDLEIIHNEKGNLVKPKATYVLSKVQRTAICNWIKDLKLPDGCVSNLERCIDWFHANLHGMKSHDCHVFMQRLLPIAFDVLPKEQWTVLTEISQYFRELTSTTLNVEMLMQMEKDIPIILCKLEQFLPPGFFDSMEHLPLHLASKPGFGVLSSIDGCI